MSGGNRKDNEAGWSGEPRAYENRYVAFIDVLGFGALIAHSGRQKPPAQAATIKRICDAVLWSLEETSDSDPGVRVTQFSDSFVISSLAPASDRLSLVMFVLTILNVIHCFIGSRLLLRGGITRGPIVHTATLLFGPAMNRAYELENKIANVPRIIVDPKLSGWRDEKAFKRCLSRDDDELYFVDYFMPLQAFFLVPGRALAIQRIILKMPPDPKLREKRDWLVRKHNSFVDGFDLHEFKERLARRAGDTDNNAIVTDAPQFLRDAKALRRLPRH